MRHLTRFLVLASARFLENEYAIPFSSIILLDKGVIENDIPKRKVKDVQGELIDEKIFGSRQRFVSICLNAATPCLILWIKLCMKNKVKILRNFV